MKGGGVVAKYLVRRILHGLLSIIAVVAVVMILVYALGDRQLIFMADPLYTKQNNNNRIAYTYRMWEEYGYLDYVPFGDYLNSLVKAGGAGRGHPRRRCAAGPHTGQGQRADRQVRGGLSCVL